MASAFDSDFLIPSPVEARDSNVMIQACLSLLAGAYALHFTSFESGSDLVLAASFTAALIARTAGRVAACMFLVGLALFLWHSKSAIDARLEGRFEGDSMLTVVRIAGFPRAVGDAVVFLAEPLSDSRVPVRIRLGWYGAQQVPRIGDTWQFEVRLKRPRGTRNPGVFDYEAWLFRERIGATGYVVNGKRNRLLERTGGHGIDRVRNGHVERLAALFPDQREAAVLAAITVGARHLVSHDAWSLFAATGTNHLMAISGLHVGLAGTSAYFIALVGCALLRRRGNYIYVGLVSALLMATAYSSVSGFGVPAQRATLMILFGALVLLRGREIRSIDVLGAACIVLVVLDPLATMMPGFQLSFLAVAVLLWWASRRTLMRGASRASRLAQVPVQIASMQLGLLFGLMPITALVFHRVSLVAPAVNFVAVPLFSVVTVPFALLGFAMAGLASIAGDAALRVSAASIGLLIDLLDVSSELPFASFPIARITGIAWLSLALVAAWAVFPPGWPGRSVAWLAIAAIVSHRIGGPPVGCVDLRMLDVGQGLAAVLRTRTHTLLYDTGPATPGGASAARRVVIPYLRAEGVSDIDLVIVSHSDTDHAGGLEDILDNLNVREVVAGEPLRQSPVAASLCRRGMRWSWDTVDFVVLHPPAGEHPAGNDSSCVLEVIAGERRMLLTGDIGAAVEASLVRTGLLAPADVVAVPHHGSETSSIRPFVDALRPQLALVSAGYRNRWSLPRQNVVRRWRDAGSTVLTTSVDGALGVRLCGDRGIEREDRYRTRSRRLWHAPQTE